METIIFKFLKFSVVGGSGVIVDFAITYLCKEKIRINKYISNTIGFTIAATSNYLLNRIWTFSSTNENITTEYFTFMIVSVVGLIINLIALWIIHGKMKFNFYFAKLCAIGVATLWNFYANYMFTFH